MTVQISATLGSLAKYINGRAFKPAEWGRSGLPIVRIANLNSPSAPYDYFSGPLAQGHLINTGDIVVSWSATLDAYIWDRGPAALNQHSFKVIPHTAEVDKDYLFFVLKHAMLGLIGLVHGATMKHVTRPEFEGYEVTIVTELKDQRRIAAGLKAKIATFEDAHNAVVVQISDVRRLIQAILDEAFAETADAEFVKVGEVTRTTSGSTPSRGRKDYWDPPKHPWVKTGEVAFKPISKTEELISDRALAECSLSLLPPGTVLIAMYGQGKTRGQSAVLEVTATTNQACFAILPNDQLDPEYLQFWLRHSYQALRAQSEARGGNQSNLNGAMLNNFEVPLLPLPRQQAIAKRIKVALAEAEILQALLSKQLNDIEQMEPRLLAETFNKLDHQAAQHG